MEHVFVMNSGISVLLKLKMYFLQIYNKAASAWGKTATAMMSFICKIVTILLIRD